MTTDQQRALGLIIGAIVEAVRVAGPLGAPSGVIYAALSAKGCTLNQFQSIMGALERRGVIHLEGDCYLPGDGGAAGERGAQP